LKQTTDALGSVLVSPRPNPFHFFPPDVLSDHTTRQLQMSNLRPGGKVACSGPPFAVRAAVAATLANFWRECGAACVGTSVFGSQTYTATAACETGQTGSVTVHSNKRCCRV